MKILILAIFVVSLSSCAHWGGPAAANEEGWVVQNNSFLFWSWSDFYYCRAKKSADGKVVDPACYEADMKQRTQLAR